MSLVVGLALPTSAAVNVRIVHHNSFHSHGNMSSFGYVSPAGPGFSDPSFSVFGTPPGSSNFGFHPFFGAGFSGQHFGAFGNPNLPGNMRPFHFVNNNRFPHSNFGYYYGPWYDLPIDYPPIGATSGLYTTVPNPNGYLFATDELNGYGSAQHPRPQIVHFAPPLDPGKAQVTILVPADADVTMQGKRIEGKGTERVFVTDALKGPTALEFKVTRNDDGKPSKQTLKVSVKPGDRQQVVVIR
jgi:uncharacterized protein (TIGR03000 family)